MMCDEGMCGLKFVKMYDSSQVLVRSVVILWHSQGAAI